MYYLGEPVPFKVADLRRKLDLPLGLEDLIAEVREKYPWVASNVRDFVVDAVRRRVEFFLSQGVESSPSE